MRENTTGNTWAVVARWAVAIGIIAFGVGMELDTTWPGAAAIMALAMGAFWLLKAKSIQQKQPGMEVAGLRAVIRAVGKDKER